MCGEEDIFSLIILFENDQTRWSQWDKYQSLSQWPGTFQQDHTHRVYEAWAGSWFPLSCLSVFIYSLVSSFLHLFPQLVHSPLNSHRGPDKTQVCPSCSDSCKAPPSSQSETKSSWNPHGSDHLPCHLSGFSSSWAPCHSLPQGLCLAHSFPR